MSVGTLVEWLTKFPPGTLVGSMVRAPLKLIPRTRVMTVRAGLNQGASWIAGSSVHGCWLGTYESEKQQLLAQRVKPGMTVWDVGANAGFYTLAFSRLVGPGGRVYAFEPLAQNADNLLAHLRLNKVGNAVLVQAALAETGGTAGFRIAASNSMGRLANAPSSYLVPCLTLDAFIDDHPDAAPDLIKADIEGGESRLLEGAARFLARNDPIIVLSLHGAEQCRRCAELLESYGYSLFGLDGRALERGAICEEIYAQKRTGAGGGG